MTQRPLIAIVDDDKELLETLQALMLNSDFDVLAVRSGAEFRSQDKIGQVVLALVDLKLDGESGLDLALEIRQTLAIPVVMLTGTGDEIDRIIGLETGADDYIMKPFNPRELVARVRAVLRRSGTMTSSEVSTNSATPKIRFGPFLLDLTARELVHDQTGEIYLSNAEFRLLEYLARNAGKITTRSALLEVIGADASRYMDRTIDVLILRLRRKIELSPSKPEFLQTRRTKGYIFVTDGVGPK